MSGIRPEYLIPVLSAESGLNPALQNQAGHDYWGLNQLSGKFLRDNGVDPQDYLTWTASAQLNGPILTFLGRTARQVGVPRSAVRTYQMNFAPATLKTATGLNDAIYSSPSAAYSANRALDKAGKGYISVGDLADFVAKEVNKPDVKAAIDAAYEQKPEEKPNRQDPLLGEDFTKNQQKSMIPAIVIGGLIIGTAAFIAFQDHDTRRRMA